MYMQTKQAINAALKVLGMAGLSGIAVDAPNSLQGLEKVLEKSPASRADRNRLFAELKRQGLVHVAAHGDTYHFTLTPAGVHRLQQTIIDELTVQMPQKWDKKWRIVSFDVPVQYSRQRAAFASRLKNMGFSLLQKSMWVHPAPCFDIVEQLAGHYNLMRYCVLMEASKLDELSTRRLLRHYSLSI